MLVEAVTCLAMNIYYEARNQPIEGQIAVAQVVMNRVKSKQFPNSVCGVVYQKAEIKGKEVCQFSWLCEDYPKVPRNIDQWIVSKNLAKLVIHGKVKDYSKGALFYHATHVNPGWKNVTQTVKIQDHIFYKKSI